MTYNISDKVATLKPSAIREIFKYMADPSVISLAAGDPAPESLPVETMRRIMGEIAEQDLATSLLYSQSEGHPPFRAALKEHAEKFYGVFNPDMDDLIVVSGAQQCMDLACKVLCNEGDTVICEAPSFIGSLNCFRSYNVNLVGVPMESDGIDIAKLEAAIKGNKNVRMMYLIPNFQNPTGITMSLEKRKAVYELAKKYGVLILEDNPYGDLRFSGEPIPTIKSLDKDGLVLYAGTFSKILSTGIRVGYLIAPQGVMPKLVVAKQCVDVHTGMLQQLVCHRFLQEEDMAAHINAISKVYDRKCNLMLSELDKIDPAKLSYTRPQGGLFIWATLPEGTNTNEFCSRLIQEKKVAAVPGSAFLTEQDGISNSFRVNFSTPSPENIKKGIGRIAELIHSL